jgi:hypothetical protein
MSDRSRRTEFLRVLRQEPIGRIPVALGQTDCFNVDTPREKILALAEAGHKYGRL